ncbi:G-protein coupled receptor Mth2-like [Cydia fagiglandana]|uniref:G-protein coupled receptor Mth2-like n=1 Tax=Cydia fagiglandana TaxID=1458189 RepID=UPI002FEDFC74
MWNHNIRKVCYILLTVASATLGMNKSSSYCCSGDEEIWVDDDGLNQCLDTKTNATTKITLACFDNMTAILTNNSHFPVKLGDGGRLIIMEDELAELTSVEKGDFCLGQQSENGTLIPSVVLICLDAEEEEVISQDLLGYFMAVSSVFLVLTALVYLALPELRDLQGKSIVSLCISLAIANILMCILKVMAYENMTWCAIRGFLAYYFIISSFFWMNAIAVQILHNIKRSTICSYGWKEFLWYALYGWGVPALFTIILLIVNYTPGRHEKPGIGHTHCWFHDLRRIWIYMYSVMTILIAANVAIFVYASIFLWKHTFSSTHLKALRYKFTMMLRLFVIMGLPWIFEMVTSLTPVHIIGVILDIINCLQGLIIFVILVVFRRRVIKALHKRRALCCLNDWAEKYLALADDEENDMVTHTMVVPMEEK